LTSDQAGFLPQVLLVVAAWQSDSVGDCQWIPPHFLVFVGWMRQIPVVDGTFDVVPYSMEKHLNPKTKHPLYKSWLAMIQRCSQPGNPQWKNFGGKGIAVCEAWKTFDGFLQWAKDKPPGSRLTRIDDGKGYAPENCTWAAANSQKEKMVKFEGTMLTVSEWARRLGMPKAALLARLRAKSVEDAFGAPFKGQSFRISYSGMMNGKEAKNLMSKEFKSLDECLEYWKACIEKAKGEPGTKSIKLLNGTETVNHRGGGFLFRCSSSPVKNLRPSWVEADRSAGFVYPRSPFRGASPVSRHDESTPITPSS
jgi:hypothetical protein